MKLKKLSAWLVLAALVTACDSNVEKLLSAYVEETVDIQKVDETTLKGSIPFKHTEYFTNYRHVCDTEVCGYDREQRCNTRYHCTGTPRSCTSDSVCRDVPDTVCRTDAEGREHCTTTSRRECDQVERCTGGGEVCTPYSDCDWIDVPRYCQVNCRNEPFRDSRTFSRASEVTVKVTGTGSVPKGKILDLVLGVHTNGAYQGLFNAATQKPKEIEELLRTLSKEDKSLLILKSEGYQLTAGQNFLRLPPDFKAGDPVSVEVHVEPASNNKKKLSGVGSPTALPVLHTSSESR